MLLLNRLALLPLFRIISKGWKRGLHSTMITQGTGPLCFCFVGLDGEK